LADRVHNDGIELLGEVGILGASILFLLFISYFKKIIKDIDKKPQLARFTLLILLLSILFFQSWVDFSLHAPGIVILLMSILSIGLINFKNSNS
jgi:O-antigen ligase